MKRVFYVFIVLSICLFSCTSAFASSSPDDQSFYRDNTGDSREETTVEVVRVSARDTSGLHAILLSLIGDYNPIVKDYTYQNTSGYISHSIEITPDYSWIMTCALFIVIVYCFFRFLGSLVYGGKL